MIIKQHNQSGRLVRIFIIIFTAGIVAACSTAMPDNSVNQTAQNTTTTEAKYSRTLTRKVYKVIEQVLVAREENRYQEALTLLQPLYEVIETDTLNNYERYTTLVMLGATSLEMNDIDKAIQYFSEALEQEGVDVDSRAEIMKTRDDLYLR